MNSYEIVKAAINNEGPPRLPVRFESFGCDDTAFIPVKESLPWDSHFEGEDDWGCNWEKTEVGTMGQVKEHPLRFSGDLSILKYPDWNDDTRYTDVPAALSCYEKEGKYVFAGIFMLLFERMHGLYGFENVLCDLLANREIMEKLADRILQVQINFVDNIKRRFGNAIYGFHMSDDWGTQKAAFIDFDLWMDFFYPRYKCIFDTMHDAGYDVWLHSCGRINELLEGYIRAGVDVVNVQQPRALGIPEIGKRYRGRICFESLADIQHTLPTRDLAKIEADTVDLIKYWAVPSGGFIFSDYGDDDHDIGLNDPQIKLHMYRKFSELSKKVYGNPLPEPKL